MIALSRQQLVVFVVLALIASMVLGVVLGMAMGPQGPQGEPGPIGAQGPAGPQGPAGASATFVFDPVQPIDDTTLTNILFNGGKVSGPVLAGSDVQVSLHYDVKRPASCPGCIQQLLFGFASDPLPSHCIESGQGGALSGDANFTLTAPSVAGLSYIRFSRRWMMNCKQALAAWGSEPQGRILGMLAVFE
jgi:hypothetical protein